MSLTVNVETDELRQKTVEIARKHKASWIELGQHLFTIYKDKHYKSWGYLSFETYCLKELGVKQTTASKLLKSYSFLEREEPRLVSNQTMEEEKPSRVPNYESVNLLRLAKENEKIAAKDYAQLRHSVIENAKEPKEVRTEIKKIEEEKIDRHSEQFKKQHRHQVIKRLITSLKTSKRELEAERVLPAYLLKQMGDLLEKLETQIED